MPGVRSRIFRLLLRHQRRETDTTALLPQRRTDLEASAQRLPMPRGVEMRRATVGIMTVEWLRPADVPGDRVILYLHGGAYTMGSCATHRSLAARIAAAGRSATLQPEYRLAPEHPSPAALEECTAAYRHLLDGGTPPAQIAVVGDSAGGGLALALAVGLRDAGIPLPAALVYLSPWTDLAMTGESVRTRATVDPVCTVTESALHAAHYAGCAAARAPRVSPVYADLHGLPPLLLHVGDLEILLSDATRVADRARAAGVDVTLQVCPGMWHVWHLLAAWVPEARSGRSARSSTNT